MDVHGGVDSAQGQLQETSPSNLLAAIDLTSTVRLRPVDRAVYFMEQFRSNRPVAAKSKILPSRMISLIVTVIY
jgi:hypothetical protein